MNDTQRAQLNLKLAKALWPEREPYLSDFTPTEPMWWAPVVHRPTTSFRNMRGSRAWRRIPDFSGTWEGMGTLIERMAEKGQKSCWVWQDGEMYRAAFGDEDQDFFGHGSTIPEAIALAAASALGIEAGK